MGENIMIIKTKKLSPREVKKKLRDFIDEISDGCGPEIERMADELKAHGDEFIDALSGQDGGSQYRGHYRNDGNGGYGEGDYRNGGYMRGGRAYHRNEGTWEQREELRKRNEHKLQEMERQLQEMRQHMMQDM